MEKFLGARGRKCRPYEQNYHSSKGELLALDFALKKFSKFLLQGPFTVRTDNTTVTNWQTMNVEIMNSACVRRWLENFSRFNMKLQHMPGKLIPSDPFSRAPHIPEGTPSELDSIDYEPRYELPWPLSKLQTDEFLEEKDPVGVVQHLINSCLLYTSPSPRDMRRSRMPSSA